VIKLGISLALIMVLGYIPLGFSEQLEQCNNPNHILVQRTNGNLACVYERTAERLGWEIIEQKITEKIVEQSLSILGLQAEKTIESVPEKTIEPSQEIITDLSYTGYWLPIPEEDSKDFAKKFASAADDSLTGEKNKYGTYITEHGKIKEHDSILRGQKFLQVYGYYGSSNLYFDFQSQKQFTKNFMNSMGFEYDKEEDFGYHNTPYGNVFSYRHDFSKIVFEFGNRYNDSEFKIIFHGWTNEPELIVFPLSEELAFEKAIALADDFYSSGDCGDAKPHESPYFTKYIWEGFPFYEFNIGACWTEEAMTGLTGCGVTVKINAMNQTDSLANVWCFDG